MAIGVRILSVNLSGMTTNVTFLPQSGGTIDLGTQIFPFNYISEYYWGTYNCYVPTYATMYPVVVPGPTPTPTPSPTPTPEVLVDAILINNNEYLIVGDNEYLMY